MEEERIDPFHDRSDVSSGELRCKVLAGYTSLSFRFSQVLCYAPPVELSELSSHQSSLHRFVYSSSFFIYLVIHSSIQLSTNTFIYLFFIIHLY